MKKQEIQEYIMSIRKKNKIRPVTNSYFIDETKEYECICKENTILYSHIDGSLKRVFFVSCKEEELVEALASLSGNIVLDYVAKQDDLEQIMQRAEFRKKSCFLRLSQPDLSKSFEPEENPYANHLKRFFSDSRVSFLGIQYAEQLNDMIHTVFDETDGHFFDFEELKWRMKNKKVVGYVEDGRIISFFIYSYEGKKFYGNFAYNGGDPSLAVSMFVKGAQTALKDGCTYGYSWIDETNDKSLRFAQLKGYKPDGVKDYIYVKDEN